MTGEELPNEILQWDSFSWGRWNEETQNLRKVIFKKCLWINFSSALGVEKAGDNPLVHIPLCIFTYYPFAFSFGD